MRMLRLAPVLVLLCCCAAVSANGVAVYQAVRPATVAVYFKGKVCGAAYVVHADGWLATCAHCVDDNKTVTVRLADGGEMEAKVVVCNPGHDVAILKVEAKELKPVRFAPVDDVQPGMEVFALGHPFGDFSFSITKGIVSGINRTLPMGEGRVMAGLIQADVAAAPGNSGGPLVNAKGELVGMVSAKLGPFAFAIPASVVRAYLNEARTGQQAEFHSPRKRY